MFPTVDLAHELTEGFAARFIRYKVARLVDRTTIRSSDADDMEQELKLHLVRRFSQFDPALSRWNSFVVTVVERYILTFLVMRRRRRNLRFAPLEEFVDADSEPSDVDRTVAIGKRHSTSNAHDPRRQLDLALDVRHVLSCLPERTRRLCERLMIDSLAEVARQLQMPRTTLHGHILLLRNGFTTAFEEKRKKVPSLRRHLQ